MFKEERKMPRPDDFNVYLEKLVKRMKIGLMEKDLSLDLSPKFTFKIINRERRHIFIINVNVLSKTIEVEEQKMGSSISFINKDEVVIMIDDNTVKTIASENSTLIDGLLKGQARIIGNIDLFLKLIKVI